MITTLAKKFVYFTSEEPYFIIGKLLQNVTTVNDTV